MTTTQTGITAVKQLQIPGIGGLLPGELIVDLFAGGGGASTGIEAAVGRPPDIAINHDPAAIRMHEANHPATHHRCESIYDVDPRSATNGQGVGLLWASPSCTHFSRARGGTPVSRQLRGLGWMIVRWAGQTRPRVVLCENVPEWLTWGPVRHGQPQKSRAGKYFQLMVAMLRAMGYVVEWRVLNAAEFNTPTTRKRLFLVARCDGQPIVWPEPTNGPNAAKPYRTAAECIDWTDVGRSIFGRKKPLATATCRRIAAGIVRYVIEAKLPFIVPGGRGHGVEAHGLVTAFLAKHYGGVIGHGVERPLGTVTAVDHHSLVAASLVTMRGTAPSQVHGEGIDQPLRTLSAGGTHHALVAAFLTTYYTGGGSANGVDAPVPTIVTKARHGLITLDINGITYAITDIRLRMLKPSELARAQGFPSDYVLTGTQAEQIGRIGNSVCPPVAEALVRAQMPKPTKPPKRRAA